MMKVTLHFEEPVKETTTKFQVFLTLSMLDKIARDRRNIEIEERTQYLKE